MEICKTVDDAAKVYDTLPGQRNTCRAWVIRRLINKLQNKLFNSNSKSK